MRIKISLCVVVTLLCFTVTLAWTQKPETVCEEIDKSGRTPVVGDRLLTSGGIEGVSVKVKGTVMSVDKDGFMLVRPDPQCWGLKVIRGELPYTEAVNDALCNTAPPRETACVGSLVGLSVDGRNYFLLKPKK